MPIFPRSAAHLGRGQGHGNGPRTQWRELNGGPEVLLQRLTELYWVGVERDLVDFLQTLQKWSQDQYLGFHPQPGDGDDPEEWLGFESFVKRATGEEKGATVDDVLAHLLQDDVEARYTGVERMAHSFLLAAGFLDIDKLFEYRPPEYGAGVLLRPRAAQLESVMVAQPAAVTLEFEPLKCTHCSTPIRGTRFQCVRGCFAPRGPRIDGPDSIPPAADAQRPVVLCETCGRICGRNNNGIHLQSHLTKLDKNCVLSTAFSTQNPRDLCSCSAFQHPEWRGEQLYPFREPIGDLHDRNCPLVQLQSRHCRAKYADLLRLSHLLDPQASIADPSDSTSTLASASANTNSGDLASTRGLGALRRSFTSPAASTTQNDTSLRRRFGSLSMSKNLNPFRRSVSNASAENPIGAIRNLPLSSLAPPAAGLASVARMAGPMARLAVRRAAKAAIKDIPYGNVHMALMVGPLIIENGVPDTKRGVLISVRGRLQLLPIPPRTQTGFPLTSFAVDPRRRLWTASRRHETRRIKAFMKQVVGGTFANPLPGSLEDEIVRGLAEASRTFVYNGMRSEDENDQQRRRMLEGVMGNLRRLLQARLTVYLQSIVNRLMDPEVQLAWDFMDNHCQKFCETIIDRRVFGSFLADDRPCRRHGSTTERLYLVSFVCRVGTSQDGFPKKVRPTSKDSAPNGLTEEYLLRFRRYGHHNDSDMIDTLNEYWTDWGAFGGPIFPHQDLFPWDCTEARPRGSRDDPKRCGDCTLAQHLWAFPFDSWSIIQLHLYRERIFYPSTTPTAPTLTDLEWASNRLRALEGLRLLSRISLALSRSRPFRAACHWTVRTPPVSFPHLRYPFNPKRRLKKTPAIARSNNPPARPPTQLLTDRAKLAGIHRAQPLSHAYEHGPFHDCTLARWADLRRADQVAAYKVLRGQRAEDLEGQVLRPRARGRERVGERVLREMLMQQMRNGQYQGTGGQGNWFGEFVAGLEGGASVDSFGLGTTVRGGDGDDGGEGDGGDDGDGDGCDDHYGDGAYDGLEDPFPDGGGLDNGAGDLGYGDDYGNTDGSYADGCDCVYGSTGDGTGGGQDGNGGDMSYFDGGNNTDGQSGSSAPAWSGALGAAALTGALATYGASYIDDMDDDDEDGDDGYDDGTGYDDPGYDDPGYDDTGYGDTEYDASGYDDTGYDYSGYDYGGGYDGSGDYYDGGYDYGGYDYGDSSYY